MTKLESCSGPDPKFFHPKTAVPLVKDIGCDTLTLQWIPRINPDLSLQQLKLLKSKDNFVGRKCFQRLNMVSLRAPFGPLMKDSFWACWGQVRNTVKDPNEDDWPIIIDWATGTVGASFARR